MVVAVIIVKFATSRSPKAKERAVKFAGEMSRGALVYIVRSLSNKKTFSGKFFLLGGSKVVEAIRLSWGKYQQPLKKLSVFIGAQRKNFAN